MNPHDKDPKKLGEILKGSSLSAILLRSKLIESFNMALTRYLPSRLLTHCQVMNYENSIVIIRVDNATWATQLRYSEQELIAYFQNQLELPNVSGVKYKLRF